MSPHSLAGTLAPERETSGPRRLFAYLGPATLVGVGYMDPGNWATDIEGGARFGHALVWVLVAANAIALVMQTLAARLGVVARLDLAQACRQCYPPAVVFLLWVLCEVAIIACDLAEVLGSAIALNLLFGIPLAWGAVITALDVLLLLGLEQFGIRRLEAFVLVLVTTIGACLAIEWFLAAPSWRALATGLRPSLGADSVYVAVAILGATVMPHNLYLHSSLVQTRVAPTTSAQCRRALRFNLVDTLVALNLAFVINLSIMGVAATVFHPAGIVVTDLRDAQRLLTPLLGTSLASLAFAIALLSAGQSSTLTGTLAGQVVMQGFLRLRGSAVTIRLVTRAAAIVPALVALSLAGDDATVPLLIGTQVVLCLQLPFALVPLVRFTSSRTLMGAYATTAPFCVLAGLLALLVIACNAWLVFGSVDVERLPSAPFELMGGFLWLAFIGYLAVARLRHPGGSAATAIGAGTINER